MQGKRISVGLLKFKHTSFDAATSSVKVKTDKSEPSKKRGSDKVNLNFSVLILMKYMCSVCAKLTLIIFIFRLNPRLTKV